MQEQERNKLNAQRSQQRELEDQAAAAAAAAAAGLAMGGGLAQVGSGGALPDLPPPSYGSVVPGAQVNNVSPTAPSVPDRSLKPGDQVSPTAPPRVSPGVSPTDNM